MEKNKDNPRWKRANPARWVRGRLVYFIAIGRRLWISWFYGPAFLSFFLFFFFLYYFRGEVRVQLSCGRLTRLSALVWAVWNLLHITFEDILPHCSFVSPMKTLSDNYFYKSISTLPSKIRMNYFFSFHHSLGFKRKPLDYLTLSQPSGFFFFFFFEKNDCFRANEEDAFPLRPS